VISPFIVDSDSKQQTTKEEEEEEGLESCHCYNTV
jgi:hypothetical protein